MNLHSWYREADSFDWQGHNIVYRESVSGKPWLVLIHGFPTASFDWWKIWDELATRFNLLAPDMIGFGYSDKPKDFPYSIMKQADLIEDLLREKNITSFHLMAHDYGDTVAQELIARNIEEQAFDLKSVCLLNGGIFPESHHPILIQKLLMSPIGFILSRMLNQRKFEKSFGSIFGSETKLSKEELAEYWELVSYKGGHRIAHKIIRYMRERVVNRERWVSALQNCPCPLGLINGPEDPISGQVMIDRYREIISEDNIWILDGIGHYPQLEDAEGVLKSFFLFQNL